MFVRRYPQRSLFAECPLASPLGSIPLQVCGVNYGQIQKLAFWRRGNTPFTANSILTSAAWATAVAGTTDATKAIVTNYVTNFAVPVTTAVEQTSDTNINAIPELQRGAPVKATWMNRSLSAAQITAMQELTPYSQVQPGVTTIGFVGINQDNQVIYNANAGDLLFPMFNIFTSDTDITGVLGALNNVASEAYLLYGWSQNIAIGQMAFDFLNTYPSA